MLYIAKCWPGFELLLTILQCRPVILDCTLMKGWSELERVQQPSYFYPQLADSTDRVAPHNPLMYFTDIPQFQVGSDVRKQHTGASQCCLLLILQVKGEDEASLDSQSKALHISQAEANVNVLKVPLKSDQAINCRQKPHDPLTSMQTDCAFICDQ